LSRRRLALLVSASVLVCCGAEPEQATPALERPLREAMLTTPLACTPSGPAVERVLKTEDHGVAVCPGFVRWGVVDGMRLDVDGYPTIIEVEVDRPPVASHEPGLSGPYLSHAKLMRLRGRVLSVVSGSAPVGSAEFSVLTLANWNVDLNYGGVGSLQGGWPRLRLPFARPRGLVFLPIEGIDDLAMLGCAEGHVVWLGNEAGEAIFGTFDGLRRSTAMSSRLRRHRCRTFVATGDHSWGHSLRSTHRQIVRCRRWRTHPRSRPSTTDWFVG
jgi:hypothetical protein